MLAWIGNHPQLLNVLVNLGLLLVWLVYLQFFVVSYRRGIRPKLVINRGVGDTIDAVCLVSNMSGESIYIESINVTVEVDGRRWSFPVTDSDEKDDHGSDGLQSVVDLHRMTRQGPLQPGTIMQIGRFRHLIERGLPIEDRNSIPNLSCDEGRLALEVEVIADYASEDLPVGAQRRFEVCQTDERLVLRTAGFTRQIRSRTERRQIQKRLQEQA